MCRDLAPFPSVSCDGQEQVGRDGDPDLSLLRVPVGAVERLDSEVLLDPHEEQLDLPTHAIQLGDREGAEREVARREVDLLAGGRVPKRDEAKMRRVIQGRGVARETDGLVADEAGRAIQRPGIDALPSHAARGPPHKDRVAGVQPVQRGEVNEAADERVDRSKLGDQNVQDSDVGELGLRAPGEGGDAFSQIERRMHIAPDLGRSEPGPGKNRKTQVDGRGVEGVDRAFPLVDLLEAKRLAHIETRRFHDEPLSEIGEDAAISVLVRVGQCAGEHGPP